MATTIDENVVRATSSILNETQEKFQVIQLIAAVVKSSSLRERIVQTFCEVSTPLEHYELVAEEYAQFFAENQFTEANDRRADELELHLRDSFKELCRTMRLSNVAAHIDPTELGDLLTDAHADGVVGMTRVLSEYFALTNNKLAEAQADDGKLSKYDSLAGRLREGHQLAQELGELQAERSRDDAEREHAVQVVDQRISNLTAEIEKLRVIAADQVSALKGREENESKPLLEGHQKTLEDLEATIKKTNEELSKLAAEHQDSEAAARKKQRIVEREVGSIVEQYDEELLSLTGQTEELTKFYEQESKRKESVSAEVCDFVAERDAHEKEEAAKHQMYLEEKARTEEAAALITRVWERFREKAESKKKKGKKGKSKKKK